MRNAEMSKHAFPLGPAISIRQPGILRHVPLEYGCQISSCRCGAQHKPVPFLQPGILRLVPLEYGYQIPSRSCAAFYTAVHCHFSARADGLKNVIRQSMEIDLARSDLGYKTRP
jgi:hypothetical protein